MKYLKKVLLLNFIIGALIYGQNEVVKHSEKLKPAGDYTLVSGVHLNTIAEPLSEDGKVNILVEIPAGTNAKWEVNKENGNLDWEIKKGKPRIVQYLPYPSNYGMIPKTLSAEELGGDGDPLDVLLLGDAVARGEVVKARVVGVMRMVDDGEQDDKLLAVLEGSVFSDIEKFEELENSYEGILDILETWFTNYKGNDQIEIKGFGNEVEAQEILLRSIEEYKIYGKKS